MVSGQDCAGSTLVDRGVESRWDMEGQLASGEGPALGCCSSCPSHLLLYGGFGMYGQHMLFMLFFLPITLLPVIPSLPIWPKLLCNRGVGWYSQELEGCS